MLSSDGENELLNLIQTIPNELSEFVNKYLIGQTIPKFIKEALNVSLDKCSCEDIGFLSREIAFKTANNLLLITDLSSEVRSHLLTLDK